MAVVNSVRDRYVLQIRALESGRVVLRMINVGTGEECFARYMLPRDGRRLGLRGELMLEGVVIRPAPGRGLHVVCHDIESTFPGAYDVLTGALACVVDDNPEEPEPEPRPDTSDAPALREAYWTFFDLVIQAEAAALDGDIHECARRTVDACDALREVERVVDAMKGAM